MSRAIAWSASSLTPPARWRVTSSSTAFGPTPLILNDLRGLPATDLLFFARPDVMTRVLKLADDVDQYNMKAEVAPTRPRHLMNTYCTDIGIQTAVIDYVRPRDFDIVRA